MRIGILTFHWATNYGAILQAFCLQEFLIMRGHDVEIVNYKPYQYDYSWKRVVLNPKKWLDFPKLLKNKRKEELLVPFRDKYLHKTRRYGSIKEFDNDLEKYDVLISGSDQVLNPSFTLFGDNGNKSLVYWLAFGRKNVYRVGYAVSFGCEEYPAKVAGIVHKFVNGFNAIGTRENSGLSILEQLEYTGCKDVVPDPTILIGVSLFDKLGVTIPVTRNDYACVYMLRHVIQLPGNVIYIDEKHRPLNMVKWLSSIINAKYLVTNSYHGVIIAILSHVPFVALLETTSYSGMNDRFITLLARLDLKNRIIENCKDIDDVLSSDINWQKVDELLESFRTTGIDFLNRTIMSIGDQYTM